MTTDSLPQARVVRNGSQLMAPLPVPRSDEDSLLRTILSYAVGFWPLTSVMVLALVMLVVAGQSGSP
jgi:hypothetical protein